VTTLRSKNRNVPIIEPAHYRRHGYPHDVWTRLRAEEPVSWWEPSGMPPFWAITRHRDIEWIESQPLRFLSSPLLAIFPKDQFDPDSFPFRAMTKMDPPEHAKYRALVSHRFTPRAVEGWKRRVEAIVDDRLRAVADRGELDFVADVAAWVAIGGIAELLDIPREDWPRLIAWSNATMAASDPEFQVDAGTQATTMAAVEEQFAYFSELVAARRTEPGDDLVSAIATAEFDGKPLPDWELLSYVIVMMIAGNDTTRCAMAGGLAALLEHSQALERLRREPALLPSAVEELLRWTSPVVQFCRTAAQDLELRGKRIHAGQALCLFYPSANRDEEVFARPFDLVLDRNPNPHLTFGSGPHFCLGASLARLELRVFFERLLRRFETIEAAGPVERLQSSFVAGIKHLPLRLKTAR
jgi:cholest-4-en-3-one 26-monooxygenase